MKWSIFVCLLVFLARYCSAWVLRCPPGVTECTKEKKENIDTKELLSNKSHVGATTECLAGTEWDSKCHFCRCSETGIAECLKTDHCEPEIYEEPYLCKPNTTFLRDCNKCLCLDNGMALCSMDYCFDKPQETNVEESDKTVSTYSSKDKDVIVPVQLIKQVHTDNTVENYDVKIIKRSTKCRPHEEFLSDCNPCRCSSDGHSYTCTHNECLEGDTNKKVEVFDETESMGHIEPHSVCRARNTFYVSCNACHCNAHGTDYTCTNKHCPLPADVELFHELKMTQLALNQTKTVVCEANRMFVKDCNTCWCNEDGTSYFCTRRICLPLLPEEEADLGGIPAEDLILTKKECRPNEVFEVDCNMCRCNPDGRSYSCTRKACIKQIKDNKNVTLSRKVRGLSTEPPKACQPGQEFRMDCNKCLCDNEGRDFSCTRIDCTAENGNHHASALTAPRTKRDTTDKVPTTCLPGSVFNQECNVCRCTQDGRFALCTLKNCNKQKEADGESDSETGFRCNPGEQFKRDCNDCTCSADGKSVFCTLRLCDTDPIFN